VAPFLFDRGLSAPFMFWGPWPPRLDFRSDTTRRIRYAVAASLDGYIAGPKGEADWIIMDPEIDFSALFKEFETLLMGRRTFEVVAHGRDAGARDEDVRLFRGRRVKRTIRK
jgi:hypothetical protein